MPTIPQELRDESLEAFSAKLEEIARAKQRPEGPADHVAAEMMMESMLAAVQHAYDVGVRDGQARR